MAKYKQYEEYKNFESVFLDEIPVSWKVKPLSALCEFRQGKAHEPFIDDDGEFICVSARFVSTQGKSFKRSKVNITPAKLNDILMVMSDLPNGRALARAFFIDDKKKYAVNQRVCAITAKKVHAKFLYYQLNRSPYFLMFDDGSNQTNLSNDAFNKYPVLLPPEFEQTQIANFLDYETAQIDTLIDKQKTLIQLLKEKRQAVISHAVTKGLNPDVSMKDSGVEWLGGVPEHWEFIKFDYVINAVGDIDHYMPKSIDTGIPYVMTGDLRDLVSEIDFENCKQVAHSDYVKLSRKIKASKDDIIFARYATIGTLSYVDIDADFLVSYSCVTIKPNSERTSGKYLFRYLKSQAFLQAITMYINSNTQGNVGIDSLKNVKVIMPPLSEQEEIINFLNDEVVKIDRLLDKAKSAITLMQERRTALISAAVTGKIDVRGWQVPDNA
ncbi:restriction endonuclease subunit S [Psychrobacter sp. TB55-MNA-CIBAN-0194]|uniref:restriction endonuclease subunit S n=1 Tax=Psychrobacter sp. TB55-MNA-CIBAN-0194 TaxID=3140445 RepID=UPI003322BE1D